MAVCCVQACKSNSRKRKPGITFHRFPKNLVTRTKWLENIESCNWNPGPNSYVCSLHFEENSINRTMEVVRVKDNCFPTIFPVEKKTENRMGYKFVGDRQFIKKHVISSPPHKFSCQNLQMNTQEGSTVATHQTEFKEQLLSTEPHISASVGALLPLPIEFIGCGRDDEEIKDFKEMALTTAEKSKKHREILKNSSPKKHQDKIKKKTLKRAFKSYRKKVAEEEKEEHREILRVQYGLRRDKSSLACTDAFKPKPIKIEPYDTDEDQDVEEPATSHCFNDLSRTNMHRMQKSSSACSNTFQPIFIKVETKNNNKEQDTEEPATSHCFNNKYGMDESGLASTNTLKLKIVKTEPEDIEEHSKCHCFNDNSKNTTSIIDKSSSGCNNTLKPIIIKSEPEYTEEPLTSHCFNDTSRNNALSPLYTVYVHKVLNNNNNKCKSKIMKTEPKDADKEQDTEEPAKRLSFTDTTKNNTTGIDKYGLACSNLLIQKNIKMEPKDTNKEQDGTELATSYCFNSSSQNNTTRMDTSDLACTKTLILKTIKTEPKDIDDEEL